MEWVANPDIWLALVTLTALEVVLGIDNLVFIAIVAGRLPPEKQPLARRLGLGFAALTRIALLFFINWMIGLTAALFELFGETFSWRDLILIAGGLFLIAKATIEIDHKVQVQGEQEGKPAPAPVAAGLVGVVVQIAILDIVFSIDSVVTAVGMAEHIEVMVAAILIAIAVMILAAGPVTRFVMAVPTVTMLALAFLVLIGVTLVADGLGFHIPKGYIYFSMGFAVFVESLNLLRRRRRRAAGEGA